MLFRGCLLTSLLALGCGGGDFPKDAGPVDAAFGNVSVMWSLVDLEGRPVTCEQIGARTVTLELRNQGGIGGDNESFSCTSGQGTTQVEVGTYNVSINLNGGSTQLASVVQNRVVVPAGAPAALDPVTFTVDAQGGLALSLTTPGTPKNCGVGGADITGLSLTLVDGSGNCAPVTFTRTRNGASSGADYTVNCGAPGATSCIERDETLTVARMPSGPYTVHVRGKNGGVDCWINNDAIIVPAQGKTLTTTLNLMQLDACKPK